MNTLFIFSMDQFISTFVVFRKRDEKKNILHRAIKYWICGNLWNAFFKLLYLNLFYVFYADISWQFIHVVCTIWITRNQQNSMRKKARIRITRDKKNWSILLTIGILENVSTSNWLVIVVSSCIHSCGIQLNPMNIYTFYMMNIVEFK